jgi:alpha-beta hydrolase superfamily lysophospholipase/predicted ester cyclase
MSSARNRQIARRVFEEFLSNPQATSFGEEVLHPDFVDHDLIPGEPSGKSALHYIHQQLHETFGPNMKFEVFDSVASEDMVALRWRLTGIDMGLVPGRPATHQPIAENGMVFLRMKDEKVIERWATVDRLGVMQQVGSMSTAKPIELRGRRGRIVVHHWSATSPRFVALVAHGYGEHAGRYRHVAERLIAEGADVYAPDFEGHGRSEGDRPRFENVDDMADELNSVYQAARRAHAGVPIVLIGHSLGGLISTRFVQRDQPDLAALVLSGPFVGGNPQVEALLGMDPMPEVPIDPSILSRDPAVGEAYAADELVYHGGFHRETLQAIFAGVRTVAAGPSFGDLPTLWIHGEGDVLAPLDATKEAMQHLRGSNIEEHVYPGAQHEVLNEINKDEILDDVVSFLRRALGLDHSLQGQGRTATP